ncbi:quercetin dioxygenase-like cupin family protein [Kitasatospora sp. MAP12-15]|uniref:cupin domain-containing protein n=1 Tax=unclassified Kitasatospora TaxID=2633591 RepID=UPI002476F998|nr:cupin domain-containing protein [Kitasatospora sp. MAP12-44]MDH6109814.1 quercetin dioxygenase-like cupin family protein [Kitasatospora sp. MAP12-44]
MPVITPADATVHEVHGARFTSFAAPSSGSAELAAWHLDVPAGSRGVPHTVTREEVLYVLEGELLITLDGTDTPARPGDAVLVPVGVGFAVSNPGAHPARAWVTTSAGLQARLADGTLMTPPWAS